MPVKLQGAAKVRTKFAQLANDFQSFPRQDNPLSIWERGYAVRGLSQDTRPRPTVAKAGTYRGERWPGLAIQYKRKTDGKVVPVWGGVKRLRKGTVTNATGTGIRVKASGPAVVKKGQTFSGGNVLGKLKSDGHRYKRSDLQLGKARSGGLLHDWFKPTGQLSHNGKRLTKLTNKPYAARVAAKRPFHWGRTIARNERHHLELIAGEWLSRRVRRRA